MVVIVLRNGLVLSIVIVFPVNIAAGSVRIAVFPATSVSVPAPTNSTDCTVIAPSVSLSPTVYVPVRKVLCGVSRLNVAVPPLATPPTPTLIVPVPVNSTVSSAAPPAEPFLKFSLIGIVAPDP